MYRDEISRKDLKFKLKAQSLGIGSDGGSTSGITKDAELTFNWREPTEEEQTKFEGVSDLPIIDVAEINGVLPTIALLPDPNGIDGRWVACLRSVLPEGVGFAATYLRLVDDTITGYLVTPDWQLIGITGNK